MGRRSVIAVGVIIVLACAVAVGTWGWRGWFAPGPLQDRAFVVVPSGASLGDIAGLLAGSGAIHSRFGFVLGARVNGLSRSLQAGEYEFTPAQSGQASARLIASGRVVIRQLTLPEGTTTASAITLINAAPGLVGEVDGTTLPEGLLLPETYNYVWGDDAGEMAARMVGAMAGALDVLWRERAPDLPLASAYEAIILASIVERETARSDERPLVASVFINRLRRDMPLQADPTVAYAVTDGTRLLERPLTRADLDFDSPYNTYRVRGLPPGPIANPGRAALHATLHPAESNFLYFVADGAGGHLFAASLEAHKRNVRRLRALEAADAVDDTGDGSP